MAKDDSGPATKKDIRLLKGDIQRLEKKMGQKMEGMKDEIMQGFQVVAENIHHDAIGASKDEIEVIKDRVTRLEHHTGLAAV